MALRLQGNNRSELPNSQALELLSSRVSEFHRLPKAKPRNSRKFQPSSLGHPSKSYSFPIPLNFKVPNYL